MLFNTLEAVAATLLGPQGDTTLVVHNYHQINAKERPLKVRFFEKICVLERLYIPRILKLVLRNEVGILTRFCG